MKASPMLLLQHAQQFSILFSLLLITHQLISQPTSGYQDLKFKKKNIEIKTTVSTLYFLVVCIPNGVLLEALILRDCSFRG